MTAAELDLPVIPVNAIADWSGVCSDTPPRDLARLEVSVSDPRRSAEFYRRVFGFRRRATWGGTSAGSAASGSRLLAAHGRAEICLRPRGTAPADGAQRRRWAFVVTNLEDVREKVWDLGIKIARDSGEPDQIFRRRGGGSLFVHDPDGNEIELVEIANAKVAAIDRRERERVVVHGRVQAGLRRGREAKYPPAGMEAG